MKQASLGKAAIAVSVFACATMFSVDWTEQKGVSLSVESAQARVGRPLTPVSVAGVARRQGRRAAIGAAAVGAGVVGAGVAAAGYYGATGPVLRKRRPLRLLWRPGLRDAQRIRLPARHHDPPG